jgi:hypothetical protein
MKSMTFFASLILITASASAETACLRINDMWSWSPVSPSMITVETRSHAKFTLTIRGVCPAIMQNKLRLELRSRSSSDLACLTANDDVIVHGDAGPQRCTIVKIEPLVPEKPAIQH